jgi:hypothetical protein
MPPLIPHVDQAFSKIGAGLSEGEVVTTYSNDKYGVFTEIPGNDWKQPVQSSKIDGEYIERADRRAEFSYSVRPGSVSPSEAAKSIGGNPHPDIVSNFVWKGRNAIKVGASVDLGADGIWKAVYIIFSANNVTYILNAATPTDDWENGGKDLAERILDNVVIRDQAVVLDHIPTPTPKPTT